MKERVGQKIKLTNYEALLGVSNEESAVDVSIRDIHSFENHPFKVIDDDKMAELVESIKVNGVLTPVLIRPSKKTRGYEMISGHRRLHAAGLAGLSMIPAIVREMDDDTAVLAMVDANIQREELLPSEKAFAFKMKMDAMRHQGTSRHEVEKSEKWTCEKVGEAGGIGGRQVQRYIRLTELIPELIEFVDKKKIQLSLGVDISYIDTNNSNTDKNKTDRTSYSDSVPVYGSFHNVHLAKQELDELKKMFPYDWEYWIESLSKYMASTGRTYQNHFATICMWADKEKTKKKKRNYSFPEGASL